MVFDCLENVTLNSVDIYAQTPFIVEIEILDANDTQVYVETFNLIEGINTLSLNYNLVEGSNYKIGVGDNLGLYRNNNVDSSIFPINILDYVSITANTTSNPQSYYYYFYNWQLAVACEDVTGCMDSLACNFSEFAIKDDFSCEYIDGICESCEDGIIIDNDEDNDYICNEDEIISYRCIDNVCIDPSDGSGFFSTLAECEMNLSNCLNK